MSQNVADRHLAVSAAKLRAEKIYQIAIELFLKRGYANVCLATIARVANVELDELFVSFPRKESFIVRLYERLALEFESHVAALPNSNVIDRFRSAMSCKLRLVGQHQSLLTQLLPAMINPSDRLSVMGQSGNRSRSRVQAIFTSVVLGASDRPKTSEDVAELTRLLYASHLGLVFWQLQCDESESNDAAVELAVDVIKLFQRASQTGPMARSMLNLAGLSPPYEMLERAKLVVSTFVHPATDRTHFRLAENILRDLLRFRRLQPGHESCRANPCDTCLALHLPRVEAMVAGGEPISLVLPAFPAKSPNDSKVLGTLPDFGEELALRFLQERCDAIAEIYPPGADLTICSDGRVFGDVVRVDDECITAYRHTLIEMIERNALQSISVFDLDDVLVDAGYDEMRTWLLDHYSESIEHLTNRVKKHRHHREMFNGIHRFMFEDLVHHAPKLSRTQARKQSKQLAYEVIQRSDAWSRLVASFFPSSVRLSIHPQPAHGDKIGIALSDSDDPWLTPWHGVALLQAEKFSLTRRATAEARGARLVERNGIPSHFELAQNSS